MGNKTTHSAKSKKKAVQPIKDEVHYRHLFESMAQGVVYQDKTGAIIEANTAALKILGLTYDQLCGKTSYDPNWKAIQEDGSDFLGETHPSIVALKTGFPVKDTIMGIFNTKENNYRWIRINAFPIFNDTSKEPIQVFTTFDDITESRKNELELIENEQRYRSLIEESPNAIFINRDNSIVLVNKRFKALMGATHEKELLGKSPFEIFHPAYHDLIRERIKSIKDTGNAKPIEEQIVTLQGAVIDVEVYASIFEMDGEKAIHVILNDITERKKAEQELQVSELKYKNQANFLDTIIENSPFAMWISDPNGYLVRVNQVLRDTLEIPIDMDITKYNILEDENFSNQGLTYILDDVFKNHKNSRFEMFWLGSETGEDNLSIPKKLWVFGSMFPITDESGKLINVIFQYVDITERKEAEQKLIESEEKFFKIFQSSPNAILLSRLSDYKILNVNASIHTITGYTSEDLTGKKHSQFNIWKSEDDREFFKDQMMKNGSVKDFEAEFIHKSGEIRNWRTSGEIIEIRGEKFVLGIISDITELRVAETALKRQSEFINTMTENQPTGIVACDADGKLALFNQAAKEWHGVDILKIPQEQWAENYGLYKEDGNTILETDDIPLIKAFKGEKVENYEIVIKAVGQKPRLVSCNGASFFDQKGTRLGAVVVMNDITEQRLIENNLKKSEELTNKALAEVSRSEFLLNEAGRMAKIGAWEFDLATQTTKWSDQVFELHGIPVGDVPDFDFIMSCYIDGAEEILRKSVEECITKRKTYELELRFQNARNEKLWVHAKGYPVINEKDEIISLRGVVQDITEAKEYQQKIEESEKRYKTLFENQPTIIWEEDFSDLKKQFDKLKKKGVENFDSYFEQHPEMVKELAAMVKVVEVNSTGIEILEADSKEDIVKNIPFYFDSDEAWLRFKDELVALAHGEVSFQCEIPIRTVKGNHKNLLLKLIVHPDCINDLKKVLVTFQDITELKKVQSEILNTKELLETITNNLPGAVIQYKLNSDGNDALTYVSSGSNEIWGIQPEEALKDNQKIWKQIDKNSIDEVKDSIQKSYLNLSPWNVEFKTNLPNGKSKWLQGIGTPKKNDNDSVIWNSIMLDVTHRKETDESIKKYQESLQKLTIELSLIEEKQRKDIAANIHDHLSQSLVISKMKLKEFIKKNDSSSNIQDLKAVIQHLSDAIENSRKITYDLSPPVLYELGLIETMYWFAEKTQKDHAIKVSFITNQENVKLSEKQLILIFRTIQELINNTIKHAKATEIFIKFNIESTLFEILIADNGVGFDGDLGLKGEKNNSGFGLFSIKERIQNLSGTINFESKIGKGTQVKIVFPLISK